jgi:hypothetical protein
VPTAGRENGPHPARPFGMARRLDLIAVMAGQDLAPQVSGRLGALRSQGIPSVPPRRPRTAPDRNWRRRLYHHLPITLPSRFFRHLRHPFRLPSFVGSPPSDRLGGHSPGWPVRRGGCGTASASEHSRAEPPRRICQLAAFLPFPPMDRHPQSRTFPAWEWTSGTPFGRVVLPFPVPAWREAATGQSGIALAQCYRRRPASDRGLTQRDLPCFV